MLYKMSIWGHGIIMSGDLTQEGLGMKSPVQAKDIKSGFRFRIVGDATVYTAYADTRKRKCERQGGQRLGSNRGCVQVKNGRDCRHLPLDSVVEGVS